MFVFLTGDSFADCQNCSGIIKAKKTQAQYLEQTRAYLEKNNQYMKKLSPNDSSKLTKVRSNIMVASIQIETIENRIRAYVLEESKNYCEKCKGL